MPDKQWKLYKLHLLFYYYCGQIEMPFEDINTKTENMPAAGLLSDKLREEISTTWFQN